MDNSNSNNNNNSNWEDDLDLVRQYLLHDDRCPFPNHHPGIVAALQGIDLEMKRRYRDTKLQQKFIGTTTSITASNTSSITNRLDDCDKNNLTNSTTVAAGSTVMNGILSNDYEMDVVPVIVDTTTIPHVQNTHANSELGTKQNHNNNSMNGMDDDWQDIQTEDTIDTGVPTTNIGTNTATIEQDNDDPQQQQKIEIASSITKQIIQTLSDHQVLCNSPMAALAIVVHVVIVTTLQRQYICTGIPDNESCRRSSSSSTGFAAPIRDLPIGQLVPLNWDNSTNAITTTPRNTIQFRYRKVGLGTVILSVRTDDNDDTKIDVQFTSSSSSSNPPFKVTVSDHINLHSWDVAATTTTKKVAPALHYKGLSVFVRQLMEHFHWMDTSTTNSSNNNNEMEQQDHFASHYDHAGAIKNISTTMVPTITTYGVPSVSALPQPPRNMPEIFSTGHGNKNHQHHLQFGGTPVHGQFDGDLYPSGIYPPRSLSDPMSIPTSVIPGNLMGPNHPMFQNQMHRRWNDHDDDDAQQRHDAPDIGYVDPMMRPRFDPFGPPGGPTTSADDGRRRPTIPPGGTGNPNNDLAIPPPFGGNHMFL